MLNSQADVTVTYRVEGMDIHEAISRIEGIKCGYKATSCPDQLSLALKEYLSNNQ